MAINRQTLRTRALTALIFVLIMFAGLFINEWTFVTLVGVILFGCLYEFYKIIKLIQPGNHWYLFLAIPYIIMPLVLFTDLGLAGYYYTNDAMDKYSGFYYEPLLPCAVIFSLWINDTMAYLVGSFIGKTPFSKISPKKTWEGTAGGALLCMICMPLLGHSTAAGKFLSWQNWICIAAICAFFGTLGDLLESKLKRVAGLKDSGTIMPGHGGFLDRFDSLLLAVPVAWLYIKFFF